MASALIHICIAKKINEKINYNEKDLILGAIAPDLGKIIDGNKIKSHFTNNYDTYIPDTNLFYIKYKNNMKNAFTLGYYIHLYTDYYWQKEFVPKFINNKSIKMLDGTIISLTSKEIEYAIYNDYTNLNLDLIDEYKIDFSLFYEELSKPMTSVDEIAIDKLSILIDKMGYIMTLSKNNKSYTFDTTDIINFINYVSAKIYNRLIREMVI